MKPKTKTVIRRYLLTLVLAVIGAVGGYLYYRFVGCADGTCAITANPVVSTVYGGIIGGLLGQALTPGKCCSCAADREETEK